MYKICIRDSLREAGVNAIKVLHSYDRWLKENVDINDWKFINGLIHLKYEEDLLAFKLTFDII